jgi:hypothetical protein
MCGIQSMCEEFYNLVVIILVKVSRLRVSGDDTENFFTTPAIYLVPCSNEPGLQLVTFVCQNLARMSQQLIV